MQTETGPIDPLMFQLSCGLLREGLLFIERLQEKNHTIERYKNWPAVTWSDGMPEFTFGAVEPPVDYKDALSPLWTLFLFSEELRKERSFDFETYSEFRELRSHIRSDQFPTHLFPPDFPEDLQKSALKTFLGTALDRFIHTYGTTSFDEDKFLSVYLPLEAGLLWADLPVEIYVPILRVTAGSDSVDFGGGLSLSRMSEQVQLARAYRDHGTHEVNEYLLRQASHAFVLKGYSLPNGDYRQRYWGYNLSPKTTEIVDGFFGCLRVVTGVETGYAQILFVPLGWAHHYEGDLTSLQGVTVRKYPPNLKSLNAFYGEEVPKLGNEQVDAVRGLFNQVLAVTNLNGGKRLQLAIKRLNSCYMREDPDDAILDATIGLELLTSDGDSQEVMHKLALRLAALSTIVPECGATPAEIFRDVKKRIYPYRSAVVHGDDKKASKIARASEGGPKTALKLAVQYLGMAVRAIANHPDFLSPSLIDERLLLGPHSAFPAVTSD